jgi:hypothetical protein
VEHSNCGYEFQKKENTMKSYICIGLIFISLGAQAKENKVSGIRANALFDILAESGYGQGGMGHLDLSTGTVHCAKTVDENSGEVKCIISPAAGDTESPVVTLSSLDNDSRKSMNAFKLRDVLSEITQQDKKINEHKKVLQVKGIDCLGTTYSHVLDNIDIEERMECSVEF